MNSMKNIAERRIDPSPNKQTLSFFSNKEKYD